MRENGVICRMAAVATRYAQSLVIATNTWYAIALRTFPTMPVSSGEAKV